MSKKKSLGHNPLAYSTLGHASFDFIAPNQEADTEETTETQKKKANKTVVSYYLEEPLVDKIRHLADEQDTSYSGLVNQLLKKSMKNSKE